MKNNITNIISAANHTGHDIPFVPVTEQIHRYALENPGHPAVLFGKERLTYGQLDRLSDLVAHALTKKTEGQNVIIGVLLERTGYVYVAQQGILKAGAAFLPFVTSYPDERITFCLEEAECPVLITSKKIAQSRPDLSDKAYEIMIIEEVLHTDQKTGYMPCKISETDLAYCIYTSGSSGRPKGVLIEHRNLVNYVDRNEKSIEIIHYAREGRIALAMAAFSFDVSIVEEFVPLCNGQTVCLATEEEIHDPYKLAGLILHKNVNGMTCTPTFLMSILDIPVCKEVLRQIDFFDIGAEAFPAGLYQKLRQLNKDSVIMNVYGPTECTMGCSAAVMENEHTVTVGGPMANTQFYVMDESGMELPVGQKGELIICGDCVGRGYVNLPEKTRKAFFEYRGMRAYHSGDMAAWTENGKIRIFGRIDNQIKLRGFRIELDEIENVMAAYPDINSCAVKVCHGKTDYIAGYYTGSSDIDPEDLKKYLLEKLPEYMLPSAFLQLDVIPQTVNGKIDRNALPDVSLHGAEGNVLAPRNETEIYLRDMFADVLHMDKEQISIVDDFFNLGGDSLKSMVLASKLKEKGLTSFDIYAYRTVERLADVLKKQKRELSLDEREEIERGKRHKLTPMQIVMIDCQLAKVKSTMWNNMSYFFRFNKKTDPERLCRAVNAAIRNHPALAMKIYFDDDLELVQKYTPQMLPEVKLEKMRDIEIARLKDTLIRPFRMFNSPLLRVRMFLSERYSYLFFDVHHLAMDGSSLGLLFDDIIRAYRGEPLKKDYYCSYLASEMRMRHKAKYQEDREYYLKQYGGYEWVMRPEPDLVEYDRVMVLVADKKIVKLPFDASDLKAAEKYRNTTRSVLAIAAAILTLHEISGKNDIMTNWIFNNRLGSFASDSVGMMIKNLPVGIHMDQVHDLNELIAQIKRQVADGITHSSYDYFFEGSSPYLSEPMEVNYQQNIDAGEFDELHPFELQMENAYDAPGAALELEFVENDDGKNGFESEIEWAGNLYSRNKMLRFHALYVENFEKLVLDIPVTE